MGDHCSRNSRLVVLRSTVMIFLLVIIRRIFLWMLSCVHGRVSGGAGPANEEGNGGRGGGFDVVHLRT